ncbi:MAG: YncE family protein, partial [Bacteroidota bacterium]|nr:YncE family protein [Bacteroidota bacterium]
MRNIFVCIFSIITIAVQSQTLKEIEEKRIKLPNGWSLTPVGKSIELGDLPLNIAVSKSKKIMAVTNNGQSEQTIQLIDAAKEVELDNIVIAKSWYGLKFSADEKYLYASGGNDNIILQYAIVNNKLKINDSIVLGKHWPEKISPAGIEIDDAKQILYVVTKENNSLYVVDLKTKTITNKITLGAEAYSCLLSADKKILYISSWGGDKILLFDVNENKITNEIAVGDNPNEMVLNKNGKYLFVANANDNSVSVIDIKKQKVIETLNAALYPNAPSGS